MPTYVVSLEDFTPPPRYDGVPWNRARIEEASTASGAYSTVETKTLSPLDSDPSVPAERDLTTALAVSPTDYFRVVWLDASNHESAPSDPVSTASSSSNLTTLDQVREFMQKGTDNRSPGRPDRRPDPGGVEGDHAVDGPRVRAGHECRYPQVPLHAAAVPRPVPVRPACRHPDPARHRHRIPTTLTVATDYVLDPLNAPDGVYTALRLPEPVALLDRLSNLGHRRLGLRPRSPTTCAIGAT
jgi:hypothetical protein